MTLDQMRLAVYPGSGLVARSESSVALILGGDVASAGLIIQACQPGEGVSERLRELAQVEAAGPAFLALVEEGDSVYLYIHGALKVAVVLEASRMDFESTEAGGWLEEKLRGRPRSIAAGEKSARTGAALLLDLQRGVVPGAGIELVSRTIAPVASAARPKAPSRMPAVAAAAPAPRGAMPPAVAAPPAATAPSPPIAAKPLVPAKPSEAADEAPAATVRMSRSSISEREAGVVPQPDFNEMPTMSFGSAPNVIEGLTCENGHLNNPSSVTCTVCGSPLIKGTKHGERPPLGRLTAKDGQTVIVERDILIGREPQSAPEFAGGRYATFVVPADEQGVSRVHAAVMIDSWNVLVADHNSVNGTFIKPPDVSEWIRLEPGHAVQIIHGTAIAIGPYEMSFETI
jgi:hypothetical protein